MATRAEIAATVHRRLRALATDAELTTAPSGEQTEGDYTDAVDAALRAAGCVDAETDAVDVALVTSANLDAVIAATTREVLIQLAFHYAVLTDIRAGERDEKLSQIGAAVRALGSSSGGSGASAGRPVIVKQLTRRADDYEFS